MNKNVFLLQSPKDILILIIALGSLVVTLVFLPWSELNFTGNFPDWLSALTNFLGINQLFANLGKNQELLSIFKTTDVQNNLGDYAYSLFLFGVITASAIAIILVGKEDDSEKTILEARK